MERTRACLINSTLRRQKYSCLLLADSKEQIKSEKIQVFRCVRRKNKFVRVQTLSITWLLHGFCQTICLEKDSFWEVVFKTIHWKKDVIYKLNVSMRILKAFYFLPSGRLGEIVAGDEMEMFCATSEFKGLLCLKLLESGGEKSKRFCTDFLKEYILKITMY